MPYTENEDAIAQSQLTKQETTKLDSIDALIEFFGENAKEVTFELDSKLAVAETTGKLVVNGEGNLNTEVVKANARFEDLPAIAASLFLPNTPGIRAGKLDGNLTAAIALTKTGELDQSAVNITGIASLQQGEVVATDLPAPINNINSQLRFQGQQVKVEDTDLQLNEIVLTAFGDVDWEAGYNLTAQIPSLSVADVQTLTDFDLPITADGTFQLITQLSGELDQPQLRGRLENIDPVLIDQLSLETITAEFDLNQSEFDLSNLLLRLQSGGIVTASGQADITDLNDPIFQLPGQADLPADSLAQTYGISLPQDIVLGELSADFSASGNLNQQTADVDWTLSEGAFVGSGEIDTADGLILVRDTSLQSKEGSINADGLLSISTGEWQGNRLYRK